MPRPNPPQNPKIQSARALVARGPLSPVARPRAHAACGPQDAGNRPPTAAVTQRWRVRWPSNGDGTIANGRQITANLAGTSIRAKKKEGQQKRTFTGTLSASWPWELRAGAQRAPPGPLRHRSTGEWRGKCGKGRGFGRVRLREGLRLEGPGVCPTARARPQALKEVLAINKKYSVHYADKRQFQTKDKYGPQPRSPAAPQPRGRG